MEQGQPASRPPCSTGSRPGGCRPGWAEALPSFPADAKGMATRKASGEVLNALAPVLPELWGGSADLAGQQQHHDEGRAVVPPARAPDRDVPRQPVRPHPALRHPRARAWARILNGIALHGLTRPYGGTFLVFSDYMRPARSGWPR